jgi:two-component system OmpR family response regulator
VGDTHVVDVHLSNLRRKLQQQAPELRFIHTVRGVGFRLSNDLLRAAEAQELASRLHDDDERELVSA